MSNFCKIIHLPVAADLKKQVWRRLAYFLMYSFGLPKQLSGLL